MQNFSDGKVPVTDNKASSLFHLAKTQLQPLYEPKEAEAIAWWLLEHFTGVTQSQLMQEPDIHVNQSSLIHFSNALDQLKKGVPVQYVIGVVDFYKLKLKVNPHVLIPRPETEELVDLVIRENKNREDLKILDIGTGSGCIAISLAKHLKSRITAVDLSSEALQLARENAFRNQVTSIEFLEVNFLQENYFMEKEFDIMVSNPPYISQSEQVTMHINVVEYEPHIALFVPDDDPLIFYKAMAQEGRSLLKKGGFIYVEINEKLGKETMKIFEKFNYSSVLLLQDIYGKDRFIKAVK